VIGRRAGLLGRAARAAARLFERRAGAPASTAPHSRLGRRGLAFDLRVAPASRLEVVGCGRGRRRFGLRVVVADAPWRWSPPPFSRVQRHIDPFTARRSRPACRSRLCVSPRRSSIRRHPLGLGGRPAFVLDREHARCASPSALTLSAPGLAGIDEFMYPGPVSP